jgi:hypothetical protein
MKQLTTNDLYKTLVNIDIQNVMNYVYSDVYWVARDEICQKIYWPLLEKSYLEILNNNMQINDLIKSEIFGYIYFGEIDETVNR